MADQTIVSLPSRAWAECAVQDLNSAGCCARVLTELDCRGHWQVLVSGRRDQIAAIRALAGLEERSHFNWADFVNTL